MKKLALLLLTTLCFFSLSGCSHSTQGLAFPFEASDITSLTLYHYDAVPQNAEKKVITDQEEIQDLYDALQMISLQKKDAEPVASASVTIFRFTLATMASTRSLTSPMPSKTVCSAPQRIISPTSPALTSAAIGSICLERPPLSTIQNSTLFSQTKPYSKNRCI